MPCAGRRSVASRRLGENQYLLNESRARARETGWALRLLECRLAGEAAAAGRELETVHAWLGRAWMRTSQRDGCWEPGGRGGAGREVEAVHAWVGSALNGSR